MHQSYVRAIHSLWERPLDPCQHEAGLSLLPLVAELGGAQQLPPPRRIMFPAETPAFGTHWPMATTTTTTTTGGEQSFLDQLRDSFSSDSLHIPDCCGPARRQQQEKKSPIPQVDDDFPFLGHSSQSPLRLERCKSRMMGEKCDNTSVGTTSTLEESIVSGTTTSSSAIIVRRLGRMEVPKSTRRPRRRRRRVCLLENCHCPYHEPTGPIDVDSLECEEQQGNNNNRISIDVYYPEDASMMHETERISVSRRDDSAAAAQKNNTTIHSCCAHVGSSGSRHTTEASFTLPRYNSEDTDSSLSNLDEIILDETDMSRGLVGYQEGCEPEVIAKFSDSDVQRWELEDLAQEEEANDTLDLLSSHNSRTEPNAAAAREQQSPATHHSRGSSSRQSSRASRHSSKTKMSSSTTYPKTIPASAAEV